MNNIKTHTNKTEFNDIFLRIVPKFALYAQTIIERNGYEAYFVGGIIRDTILYKESFKPTDIDIATSATWHQIEQIFSDEGWNTIKTGVKHGTITIMPPKNFMDTNPTCHSIEITTYRTDGEYSDNRHPNNIVRETSIEKDLSRRDFTINAIAWSPSTGMIDLYNGIGDINKKLIRTVRNPEERFSEDALRILRAMRFASSKEFTIEDKTKRAIFECANLLHNISRERIHDELTKILLGKNSLTILIEYKKIIGEVIPEIVPCIGFEQKSKYHIDDVYTHTAKVVDYIDEAANRCRLKLSTHDIEILKWSALLHDIAKPERASIEPDGYMHFYQHPEYGSKISRKVLKDLKFSREDTNTICTLIEFHDEKIATENQDVIKWLNKLSQICTHNEEVYLFKLLIVLKSADRQAHRQDYNDTTNIDKLIEILDAVIAQGYIYKIDQLAIKGQDVINCGFAQGPKVKEALLVCLQNVMQGTIPNDKRDLLTLIQP